MYINALLGFFSNVFDWKRFFFLFLALFMVKFYACYFQDFTAISKFHSMSDLYYKVLPGDTSDQQQLIYPRRKFFFHSKI